MKCNDEKSIGWDLGSGLVPREQMDGWNVCRSLVGDRNYYALNPKPETLNPKPEVYSSTPYLKSPLSR